MQHSTSQSIIALMTDFGLGDGDVGVMNALWRLDFGRELSLFS